MSREPPFITERYEPLLGDGAALEHVPLPNGADFGSGYAGPRADAQPYIGSEPAPELETVVASSFAGQETPPRLWLAPPDLIPDRQVTILSGDGEVGKSLIALQLAVAVDTGKDWLGTLPEFGPVLFVAAEDDLDEMQRRLIDICAGQGLDLAALNSLHILRLAGKDAVLAAPSKRAGLIDETPLWEALVRLIASIRPRLLIVDNLADVFAGNENSRPEARQFVGMLRGLAIDFEMAVLLLSHPSLTGLNTGTGTSGSTAWSNSVRSRLYLERRKDTEGNEPDKDLRVLKLKKANYARSGREIGLRWLDGRFILDGPTGGFDKIAADAKADIVFLDILIRFTREERDVSPNPGTTFAPAIFAAQPDAGSLSPKALRAAMDRLFAAKKIKVEKIGPPSKQRSRIVLGIEEDE